MPALACLPFIVASILAPTSIILAWRRYGSAVRDLLDMEI